MWTLRDEFEAIKHPDSLRRLGQLNHTNSRGRGAVAEVQAAHRVRMGARRRGGPDLRMEQAAMLSPEEVEQIIKAAKARHSDSAQTNGAGNAEANEKDEGKAQTARSLGVWNAGADDTLPDPRQWLLGNSFCRGYVSSIVGAGGGGKTALRHLQAISLAAYRELTGEHVFQRTRVLLVSLEDDDKELRRRIWAARLHYNIPPSELDGWLFLPRQEVPSAS